MSERNIEIVLPLPPSANRIWRSGRRHVYRSDEYKAWLETCGWEIAGQRRGSISGPVSIEIEISATARGDADNRIKPTLDCLVKAGVIEGDSKKTVRSVRAFWSEKPLFGIKVTIAPVVPASERRPIAEGQQGERRTS